MVDLSHAIFMQHPGDLDLLMKAKAAARLVEPPTRTERVKYIRRIIGEPKEVAERMRLVVRAHRELDANARMQAAASGMEVDNLTVADIAYPLITRNLLAVFEQQLVHVLNGCISDDLSNLPYVTVGTVNFHNTGW